MLKIGKTKEHLKLIVKDQHQVQQKIMWWGGVEEELPEGPFDLAYKVRSSNYRAVQGLSVEFRAFRLIVTQPIELPEAKYEVVDLRRNPVSFEEIRIGRLTWAEGLDNAKGSPRHELRHEDEFVIWTSPASPDELRAALRVVKPAKIYLMGVEPIKRNTEDFLTQLTGLAKFALKNKSGEVKLIEIAAATAQRETTVRLGLSWLEAGGHLKINELDEKLILSTGTKFADPYLQQELFTSVKGLLAETDAYRHQISTAPPENLFDFTW